MRILLSLHSDNAVRIKECVSRLLFLHKKHVHQFLKTTPLEKHLVGWVEERFIVYTE